MAFQNTRPSIAREDFEYAQEVIRKLSDRTITAVK